MTFIADHWFDLLQSIGIIASVLFTLKSFREQTRQVKIGNLLLITQHHRELWGFMLDHPDLQRIFDKHADLAVTPVTERERLFTNMLFLHCAVCVKAMSAKVIPPVHGVEADIVEVLSYPVPQEVWSNVYAFHDPDFVAFVGRASLAMQRKDLLNL